MLEMMNRMFLIEESNTINLMKLKKEKKKTMKKNQQVVQMRNLNLKS